MAATARRRWRRVRSIQWLRRGCGRTGAGLIDALDGAVGDAGALGNAVLFEGVAAPSITLARSHRRRRDPARSVEPGRDIKCDGQARPRIDQCEAARQWPAAAREWIFPCRIEDDDLHAAGKRRKRLGEIRNANCLQRTSTSR
jgi:hypothetical protein